MNQQRYEFVRSRCIKQLPPLERRLFQFVEKKELILADQAHTEDHFVKLLQEHSPIFEAAEKFVMDAAEVYEKVQEIEKWLDDEIPKKLRQLKLIDFTDMMQLHGRSSGDREMKCFYLSDES
ncbi:hypothetical protein CR194_14635 [Salipaludibacillus keqinensis]|uniref:Uncharacterized protein n=1 Tax=Salipaludibacillus keqinensis TaxID=2045207 RepID=A0A323TH29_9BACI|nr:hypothetical protein [Salipaludibacillus keqinensis]PYZ92877.1 hypothetical protein CR194_14635 [Salipaludibacillus keqinensis]